MTEPAPSDCGILLAKKRVEEQRANSSGACFAGGGEQCLLQVGFHQSSSFTSAPACLLCRSTSIATYFPCQCATSSLVGFAILGNCNLALTTTCNSVFGSGKIGHAFQPQNTTPGNPNEFNHNLNDLSPWKFQYLFDTSYEDGQV